jgi:hypothetical protein
MADRVVGVCSELVSNAVSVTSTAGHIKIRFEWFPTCVLLSVWDGSPQIAQRKPPDLCVPIDTEPSILLKVLDELPDTDSEELPSFGGWGLNVVEVLSDAVGAYWPPPRPTAGKWMWSRFEL